MQNNINIKPPKFGVGFLRFFLKREYLEEIEGDMEEIYSELFEKYGRRKASRKYIAQIILLLRPSLLKGIPRYEGSWMISVAIHNLLVTMRGFRRYKSTFFINLIGLTSGLAATLLIFLWIQDEHAVDSFHQNDDQLYWVMSNFDINGEILTWNYTSGKLAGAMKEEFPEVDNAVRVSNHFFRPEGIISLDNKHFEATGMFVSPNFFEVMTYPIIVGNGDKVLDSKSSILVSETMAIKVFGSAENAISRVIEVENWLLSGEYEVSGVYKDPPNTANDQFDYVLNYSVLVDADQWSDHWNGGYARTYLVLKEGTDINNFNEKIDDFITQKTGNERFELFVQKYSDNYLYGEYENGVQAGGRIENVRLFLIIGVFILLIACINFMNLSTAQASRKMKEVGVKKALGVKRGVLVTQFLIESLVLTSISVLLSVVIVMVLLPIFNEVVGKYLVINFSQLIRPAIAFILITGVVAGSYPAFFLSGFKPLSVLKGRIIGFKGEEITRKGLVVTQFTLSTLFILGTIIINKQINYTSEVSLGYNRSEVITFEREGSNDFNRNAFINEINAIPSVVSASAMMGDFLWGNDNGSGYSWQEGEEDDKHLFKSPKIGYNTIETLDIKIVAGRSFSEEFNDHPGRIILNESAVEFMGLENPVGTILQYGDEETREVIGVVQDFQYGSLHQKVEPLIFRFRENGDHYLIKILPGTESVTLSKLADVHKKHNPKYVFDPSFLDDSYKALYNNENRTATLANYMSGIAIIVSCLGLLGLAAFTAERRTKEIGIRKILGANSLSIISLLTSSFTRLVLISIALSIPIGYYFSKVWLENFAYSIQLEWWIFVMGGLLSLLLAWITIGAQTWRASRINPAECLRNE